MKHVILKIGGMSCSGCASGLEKYLNKQTKIESASVNLVLAQASITYQDDLPLFEIEQYVKEAGFESLGIFDTKKETKKQEKITPLVIFGLLAIFLLYLSMGPMLKLPLPSLLSPHKNPTVYGIVLFLFVLPFFVYGRDIFKSGLKNFYHKTPNMDTLVSLGVLASFLYSTISLFAFLLGYKSTLDCLYFESSALILFFVKLGRRIENNSEEKAKEALKELVQMTPAVALLKTEDGEVEISIDEIKKNDILIAKPGMKIAVDGQIQTGTSHLDEAFLTGEAIPSKKGPKDKVLAGSINLDGVLTYQAEKIGKDSMLSEIVRFVVESTNTKSSVQKLADKISGYFVPFLFLLAVFTFFGNLLFGVPFEDSILRFITVLVVACPCALGLATPLAIVVSEGACFKEGILVKSSEVLETAYKIDTVVFDKTGTLTYGALKVSHCYHDKNRNPKEILQIVSSIEEKTTHPIGKAFQEEARLQNLSLQEVTAFKNLPGYGVTGKISGKEVFVGNAKFFDKKLKNPFEKEEEKLKKEGNSLVYVVEEKKVIALFGVKDTPRKTAKSAINMLKNMGKKVILLTGDHEESAKLVATQVGIDKVISSVLPKEKTSVLAKLQEAGSKVMMVGDGINDAPSLVQADVGISIHSGTDIAMDSASVILMQDDLEKIASFLTCSKRTMQIIRQNLFWAFFYNLCMLPIAMGVFASFQITMNPVFASLAMTGSSLTVVLNSLRLRKGSKKVWKDI